MGKTIAQVVRGVEVHTWTKEDKDCFDDLSPDQDYKHGYNSLASAEVVVDREKMELVLRNIYADLMVDARGDKELMGARALEMAKRSIEAIATAIESGSIISLGEQTKEGEK